MWPAVELSNALAALHGFGGQTTIDQRHRLISVLLHLLYRMPAALLFLPLGMPFHGHGASFHPLYHLRQHTAHMSQKIPLQLRGCCPLAGPQWFMNSLEDVPSKTSHESSGCHSFNVQNHYIAVLAYQ